MINQTNQLSKKRKGKQEKDRPKYGPYILVCLIVITLATLGYFSLTGYKTYMDPKRVYGQWLEIGAPSWSKDQFVLSEHGVMLESRQVASSFDFNGKLIEFEHGETRYRFEVSGDHDERLLRLSGGYRIGFIKKGYEHTLPKEGHQGKTRRASISEHFQKK